MQSISPEILFRGNDAWEKALPRISKLTQRPLVLGKSIHTDNLRNKITKDLKNQNLNVLSANLQFDCCLEDIGKVHKWILKDVFLKMHLALEQLPCFVLFCLPLVLMMRS